MNDLTGALRASAAAWDAPLSVRASRDDLVGTVRLDWQGASEPAHRLARAAVPLVSEVLLHVRAALDYGVYHRAWRDAGTRSGRTQFPLAETQKEWGDGIRRRWLEGVTPEHQSWIEEVQPFREVRWTRDLKILSNQDKHRLPVLLSAAPGVGLSMDRFVEDPLGDLTFFGFEVLERELDLVLTGPDEILHGREENPAVVPVLQAILKGATDVLNRFRVEDGDSPIQYEIT